jgi:hypothetical protein
MRGQQAVAYPFDGQRPDFEGCNLRRPQPHTTEPGFSYVDDRPRRDITAYWPIQRNDLAKRLKPREPALPGRQPSL